MCARLQCENSVACAERACERSKTAPYGKVPIYEISLTRRVAGDLERLTF